MLKRGPMAVNSNHELRMLAEVYEGDVSIARNGQMDWLSYDVYCRIEWKDARPYIGLWYANYIRKDGTLVNDFMGYANIFNCPGGGMSVREARERGWLHYIWCSKEGFYREADLCARCKDGHVRSKKYHLCYACELLLRGEKKTLLDRAKLYAAQNRLTQLITEAA